MGSDGEELIRYVTETIVTRWNRDSKREKDEEKERVEQKEHWQTQWFGMIPLSIHLWRKNKKDMIAPKSTTFKKKLN
ncbi:YqzE family protein [Longirhabdus pacifica]|uniref:YqzE family protein n=1 Tax=Longirhabdus pacifica TaxID=2305227 RepID=UPI001008C570|nr:YqzE family protein [Longirhabdus pacifica]